jgi:hypothetical protein
VIDVSYFLETGVHHFENGANKKNSLELLNKVHEDRSFGEGIFLEEQTFKENPKFKGVNPKPGRNLAEKLASYTGYIDEDTDVIHNLEAILGKGYQIMDKKFVCGVPRFWIPKWVEDYIAETGVKNLGPYIKPEYRDITYFFGIDFHQDIIDWPEMGPYFITMYVYLDDVNENDAPLYVMPRTHEQGATTFPHELENTQGNTWLYTNNDGSTKTYRHELLTGKCGDISLWHPFILHGTQPDSNSKPRISLRYLIKVKDPDDVATCALKNLNKLIFGHLKLKSTRKDLGVGGEAIIKGNHVNNI